MTSAAPDKSSMTMTSFLTVFSFKKLLLFIPANIPTSMTGTKTTACLTVPGVMIPRIVYKIMRNVFSMQNTMQMLALNS